MRPSINAVLMDTAHVFAQRGTCNRLQVGAVLARDGRIISTGYNGKFSGAEHCDHDPKNPDRCDEALHAEENAIVFAAKAGISTDGATLYCTHDPCKQCSRLIINAGIARVFYRTQYISSSGLSVSGVELLNSAKVQSYQLSKESTNEQ